MKISRPFIHSVLAFAIVMLFVQCNKKIIRLKNQLKHLLPKPPLFQANYLSHTLI